VPASIAVAATELDATRGGQLLIRTEIESTGRSTPDLWRRSDTGIRQAADNGMTIG
jgi:hypothetical protein